MNTQPLTHYVRRVSRISPGTGRVLSKPLLVVEQLPEPPGAWIGTILQTPGHEWKFFNLVGTCTPLSISDLQTITKHLEYLDVKSTEERSQKARKKN